MFYRPLLGRMNVFHIHWRKFWRSSSVKSKWKVVFFGSDDFAVQSLSRLHRVMQEGQVISKLSVVIPPRQPQLCTVAKFAAANQLPVQNWPLSKEKPFQNTDWDLGVVASFGHLIPQRIIQLFPMGMFNVHGSLLPRWRGAAPVIHAIMNGDKETGITIMRIKPFHFDIGDIIAQESIKIEPCVTAAELTQKMAHQGGDLLLKVLSDLPRSLEHAIPQPTEGVTLAPKLYAKISEVDWKGTTALELYNRWRAIQHMFKLQTTLNGVVMKLDEALPPMDQLPYKWKDEAPFNRPGRTLLLRSQNQLLVRCNCLQWLPFRLISPGSKKAAMTALDFYNGYLRKLPVESHYFGT